MKTRGHQTNHAMGNKPHTNALTHLGITTATMIHRRLHCTPIFDEPMSNPDRAELQRIAQQVEAKRERLQNLESQVTRLEEVRQEQARAIMALEAIPDSGASDAMIPLGGGYKSR